MGYNLLYLLFAFLCRWISWHIFHLRYITLPVVTWDKVFKSGPGKFCGRHPLKNLLSPLLNTLCHYGHLSTIVDLLLSSSSLLAILILLLQESKLDQVCLSRYVLWKILNTSTYIIVSLWKTDHWYSPRFRIPKSSQTLLACF